jgi:PKD repeat protein
MKPSKMASRRARVLALSAVLGMLAFALAPPASATGTEHWVDPAAAGSGTGCGTDAGFSTIQAAVAAATAGDTINVCPGTYAGPVTINKADLTLRGAKAGVPAGPDANPAGRGAGESVIEAAGANVINWSGAASVNTTIDGFTIRNTVRHGLALGTSGHTIVNNMIEFPDGLTTDNAQQAAFTAGRINGMTLKNNNLSGFRYGFNFQSGNLADAPTVIEGNFVDYVFTGAILGNNTADGHAIRGNTFAARPGAGGQAVNTPSRQMEISNNSMTGGGGGSGIFLPGTAPQSGTEITGNTISGYTWGIYVGTANANLPVGSPPNEVHLNNLAGNGQWSLFNQSTPGLADVEATCNWFGSASGPGVGATAPAGDRVTAGNVNFTPWLVAPAPGGDCVGGLANPTAEFEANPTAGDAPLPVDFDATDSSAPSGRTIVAYEWDFGDGVTGTGVAPSHVYTTPGEYVVTLTVTDNVGLKGQSSVTITVNAPQAAPTANATATPDSGPAPLQVILDGSGSSDSDGTIVSYEWDLGDGTTASGPVVTHTYATPGTYVATLTVTDDDGLTGETQVAITVSASNQPQSDAACKKGGWENFGFSNQGLCIRYVNTGKDARAGA